MSNAELQNTELLLHIHFTGRFRIMSTNAGEESETAVHGAVHLVKTSMPAPAATAIARSSSASSSPVSDLAQNLEVLSTDGFSSQGSSTDG